VPADPAACSSTTYELISSRFKDKMHVLACWRQDTPALVLLLLLLLLLLLSCSG
jgi:hypothetical protein